MGKSQFKAAADLVIEHCTDKGYTSHRESDYYWAYRLLFEQTSNTFDASKFDEYILKRLYGKD